MAEGVDYDLIHAATIKGRTEILYDFTYPEIDNTLSNLYDTASFTSNYQQIWRPH